MSYTKDPLFGNYLGIVVNKEDPEYRGRVQIWIPHLTNTLHSEWNDELKNKSFKHIHDSGSLTPKLVEELKKVLPWAECAAPIIGGGTSATYNDQTGVTNTNPHKTLNGSGSSSAISPLENATLNGLIKKAEERKPSHRQANFSNKWGGRCLTASTLFASAALENDDEPQYLATKGTGAFDGNSTPSLILEGSKRGESNSFTASGYYENVKPFNQSGYKAQLGDQFLGGMTGGSAGHIITCIDDGSISGKEVWASDNISGVESPSQMINQGRYSEFGLIRLNQTGLDRWKGRFGQASTGPYNPDTDEPVTKTAMDAAEIPGTSVNPAANATSADRTVKDGPANLQNEGIDSNWQKYLESIAYAESNFSPSGAADASDGNTGFFKFNQNDADTAAKNGLPDPRQGTLLDQSKATKLWIEKFRPEAAAAISSGNFSAANSNLNNFFGSLPGNTNPNNQQSAERKAELLKIQEGTSKYNGQLASNANLKSTDPDTWMVNPIPNHNPHVNSPMLAGDQPSGMLSIPNPGAKVFVFFLGGDIQKPVYFANSLEPETIKKMGGYGTPNYKTDVPGSSETAIANGTSSFTIGHIDTSIGGVPSTEGRASLKTGGTGFDATSNHLTIVSQNDANFSVMGTKHENAFAEVGNFGSIHKNASDNIQITAGFGSTPEEQKKIDESHQKLKKILDDVQKQKVEEIESNAKSGETVDCPLCSIKYATDKASAYSKKATSLLRMLKIPYFSYAIDIFEFLLQMIFIPFVAITNGSALGECGNPDCKKGQIPSPQKPIEEANRKSAETLVSKQKEIAELEQQLGNGGNYTVAVAKDFVISAGLGMNDSPCYAKTNNKSEPVSLQGAAGPCLHLKSAVLEGKVPTAPIQFPGGNVLIKGGNSVKIIAGSPGIELMTKGKLVLNCGSLEILTSDGEMVVGSTNHTTIKGKVVTIDAENGSNTGGINMNAPNTLIKGLSVSGNAAIKGSLKVEGELSCKYINTVGQRLQSDMAGSPDQRIPFGNWAIGAAQINDILNTIRTAVTHYLMPGALLTLTNIIKFVMQTYNTIMTNTVIESITTGFGIGIGYVQMWNWQHNQLEDPKPIHVDYITPKGIYFDDGSGVDANCNDPGPIPTRARKNGMGMDGGPKTLAGCGGFGNWGGGGGTKRGKLNSFGLGDVEGFAGTRLSDKNVKFEYNKDGSIKVNIDTSPC